MNIFKKTPNWQQLTSVYGLIVLVIYAWTLFPIFWRFNSWLYYTPLEDLAVIYAYVVSVNFLESILILFGVLLLNFILPAKWFYERFTARATALIVFSLSYLAYFNFNFQAESEFPAEMIRWVPYAFVAIILLVMLVDRVSFLQTVFEKLADNMQIFFYIYMPITVLAILTVLIRNLF